MKRSTPLDRNIGAKVKYYRKLRGLSQKQLAAQLQTNGCDLTETMLGHIETGYRSTSIFEIDKLAEALKVDTTPCSHRIDGAPRRDPATRRF